MSQGKRHLNGGRTAFTLVELLVVIGIIAVLISILLPALSSVQKSAKQIGCAANMRSIGQALVIYTNDNKGTLPFGYWDGTAPNDTSYDVTRAGDWSTLLAATMNKNQSMLASADRTGGVRMVFRCPGAIAPEPGAPILSTYSTHPRLMPNLDRLDKLRNGMTGSTINYLRPYRISKIRNSTDIVMLFEGALSINGQYSATGGTMGVWSAAQDCQQLDGSSITNGYSGPTGNSGTWLTNNYSLCSTAGYTTTSPVSLYLTDNTYINTDSYMNYANVRFRHGANNLMNGLCVDGHVESFGFKPKAGTTLQRRNVNVNLD